ncbi:type VI secretion system baseplate subunit TssF [Paraburkholderia silvatlantica]|uniref:type VI secretion system baseplate subunit TssF n=1 Tax=Paraburkholderia silvatlantica TaxID=321895 RepID=UPI0037500B91
MDPHTLEFYTRELRYLRATAGEFGAAHLKIARRLGMQAGDIGDRYVKRLVQSSAFVNARMQMRFDDEFPRLTQALLSCAFPNYLSPTPSVAVVRFYPGGKAGNLVAGSYPRWTAGQIRSGTSGPFEVHSGGRVFTGPDNVSKPQLPASQDMQQDLRFALRALPDEAHHYISEPYDLYKGNAKIGEGVTDEYGNLIIKNHEPGTSAYTVKLSNGGQFDLKVKDALDGDPEHVDQRSSRGERLA